MKKILTTFILFLIVIGNIKAFDYTYKDVVFSCSTDKGDSTVTIKSWDRNATKVFVPGYVVDKKGNQYRVNKVKVYFSGDNYNAEEVTIEEDVQIIVANCFREFPNLKSIDLPTTLKEIGSSAFVNLKDTKTAFKYRNERTRSLVIESGIKGYELPNIDPNLALNINPNSPKTVPTPKPNPEPNPVPNPAPVDKVLIVRGISLTEVGVVGAEEYMKKAKNGKTCAMLKINFQDNGDYNGKIPVPRKNYISYNNLGYDLVWMTDHPQEITVFSPEKKFETTTIKFSEINKKIPYLQDGMVYELKLRCENAK